MGYALRTLSKSPGFAIIAILTLALGIGANTAIFTVVNSVLLKPLRAKDPDRLVAVWDTLRKGTGSLAYLDVQELRAQNHTFEQLEAFTTTNFNLKSADRPERVNGAQVTAGWLAMFGVPAIVGRTFLDSEDRPDAARVVVLRADLWRATFAGDRNIVGKTIDLDGEKVTVVGILPADFEYPSPRTQIWTPFVPSEAQRNRGNHFLLATGRLKPGATIAQAHSDLGLITQRISERFPSEAGTRKDVFIRTLRDEISAGSQQSLFVMLGAVAFVFLIACANVANLLMVRISSRQKEISIRRALGATVGRLFGQFAIESLMLAGAGAMLGWLLALWGVDALVSLQAANIPRAHEVAPDFRVLGFTILLSLAAALVFAVTSVIQCASASVNETLKDAGRGSSGTSGNVARSLLVIGEIATALMLLVGAGLLIESLWKLQGVDPGFRADHVLTVRMNLPAAKYKTAGPLPLFWEPLMDKIRVIPGVQSAGAIDYLPVVNWGINGDFQIEGQPPAKPGQEPVVEQRVVGAEYFQALKIPLVAGRLFTPSDTLKSPGAVVINQAMAKKFWPGENAVGKRIRFFSDEWMTITGIVGDIRQSGIDSEPRAELYVSWKQFPSPALVMALVIRTARDPNTLVGALRGAVRSIDADQPVSGVLTMQQIVDNNLGNRRFTMSLLVIFAATALLLASLGIYGVMAWTVRQRTQEIGIRLALGASLTNVFQTVFSQGLRLVVAGLVLGIAGALALTRVLASFLYEVSSTDILTFASVSVVLTAVAFLAIYVPARRATKVDPMVALRYE
jgi:putative ABC transport system permease protein